MDELTQSKSKMRKQEQCTVSSIVILLTLIEHNIVFISLTISLEIQKTFLTLRRFELFYNTATLNLYQK